MNAEEREAYYAENDRRRQRAQQLFDERTWHFPIDDSIEAWAGRTYTGPATELPLREEHRGPWSAEVGYATAIGLTGVMGKILDRAVADGIVRLPEPGRIDSAYSTRHEYYETTDGIGYGFYPARTDELIVYAGAAVKFAAIERWPEVGPDAAVRVVRAVIATFASPRPGFRQAPSNWRG
ncbi:hypothetical protein ATM97_30750 [Nocardia sp. MH4]|uniref:hypothetical protein n=1 Tax=Nocardia sp. MH4 TaxID=1768677 RepID=UPI001C4F8348|nr:hypothetical protein [Nocardia sp. MH4]MBW0275788.1 hypothetical protein [Nocardia sp. MH4]